MKKSDMKWTNFQVSIDTFEINTLIIYKLSIQCLKIGNCNFFKLKYDSTLISLGLYNF